MDWKSSKGRILEAALNLFSEKGYEAVSMGQIAQAVGVKPPSLYKHYKSKHDIFKTLIIDMNQRCEKQTAALRLNVHSAGEDAPFYERLDDDALVTMVRMLFLQLLHDEYIRKYRKMLTLSLFTGTGPAALYSGQYFDSPLRFVESVFGRLSRFRNFSRDEIHTLALQFTSTVYTLLCLCDREPDREAEAIEKLEKHTRLFFKLYSSER